MAIEGLDSMLVEIIDLIKAARFTEAEGLILSHCGETTRDVRAIYLLAEIKLLKGDYAVALCENKKLIGCTNKLLVSVQEAKILVGLGELDKAVAIFKDVLAIDAKNEEALRGLERVGEIVKSLVGLRRVPTPPDLYRGTVPSTEAASDPEGHTTVYTARDEQFVIERLLSKLKPSNNYLVDIGAADGVNISNSYQLLQRGWYGLAIEPRLEAVADLCNAYKSLPNRVDVLSIYANPDNVCHLFEALGVPAEPGFMTLDIDSFEYEMVEAIFKNYRPSLLCVEINERIPPPVRFSILYDPGRIYGDISILGGCSIQLMTDLLNRFDYAVVCLEYNNLFAVPRELMPLIGDSFSELTAGEAYKEGFLDKPDKYAVYGWNSHFKEWLSKHPDDVVGELEKLLAPHGFRYLLRSTYH